MTNPHLAAFVRCTKDDSTDPDMLNFDILKGGFDARVVQMMRNLGTNRVVFDRAWLGKNNVPNCCSSDMTGLSHYSYLDHLREAVRAVVSAGGAVTFYVGTPGTTHVAPWAASCATAARWGVSELTLDAAGDGSWMTPEGQQHLHMVEGIAKACGIKSVRCEAFAPVKTVPAAWPQCVNLQGWLMQPWATPPLVSPPEGTLIIHQEGLCIDPDYRAILPHVGAEIPQASVTALNIAFARANRHVYAIGVFSKEEAESYGIEVGVG